jgi:hypothetical protein
MREFRLQPMQLNLNIAKEEVAFQDERLQKLLNHFLHTTNYHKPFARKVVSNGVNEMMIVMMSNPSRKTHTKFLLSNH